MNNSSARIDVLGLTDQSRRKDGRLEFQLNQTVLPNGKPILKGDLITCVIQAHDENSFAETTYGYIIYAM
jgi:hypothetical protein